MESRRQRSTHSRSGGVGSTLAGFLIGFGSLAAVNQLIFGTCWMKRTWLVMYVLSSYKTLTDQQSWCLRPNAERRHVVVLRHRDV